jgi:uncharacterized protein YjbI with pentapeptide repeats
MLKRWSARPSGIRWLAGIAAVVLAAAIVWALFVPLADWLARQDVGSAKPALVQTARDAARGRLLTLLAGLFAAGALAFTGLNFRLSRRTFELTEQGQVTDRYTKAIEQLGSKGLDVRIGGIYALERIARDSAKDQPTVMEVLTAFIREHSREPWPPPDTGDEGQERLTRPDVQAAVTVMGRRERGSVRDFRRIDLSAANLTRARLTGANLFFADLTRADLTGANLFFAQLAGALLTDANLADANLTRADLTGARLTGADLTRADLTGARLTGANLVGANLTRADLTGADLTAGARLIEADLADALLTGRIVTRTDVTEVLRRGADLTRAGLAFAHPADAYDADASVATAQLGGADLTGADLTEARLVGARLTGANLADARWPEGVQVPDGWTVDSGSGRLKRAGGLSEVGSGAGAVALSGVRSRSHFSPGFPCGPLHCGDHGRVLRFQPPPHRTVRAVLPHTAHRRRSPAAFGLTRQSLKG